MSLFLKSALKSTLRNQAPLLKRAPLISLASKPCFNHITKQTQHSYVFSRYQSSSSSSSPSSTTTTEKAQTISEETRSKLTNEPEAKVYTYEEIKQLLSNPDPNKILIDVREPDEYKEVAIPSSINIPYKSTPGALDLTPEEFEDIFKFEKPSKEKELIFYCLAGVRSTAAADLAKIFGYKNLGNYVGSMQDWLARENPEPIKDEAQTTQSADAKPEEKI